MRSMTIIAVVVTFNRRELLESCLHGIDNQTYKPDHLIVVNNASTDETTNWLSQYTPKNIKNSKNITLEINSGGAGGFNFGIREAYEAGADWIWIMDDDCLPEPDCLQKLLDALEILNSNSNRDIGLLASRVIWNDRSPCLMNIPSPHPLWIAPYEFCPLLSQISSSSFVSMLLSRGAIKKYGLPVKEFFIWFDDSEYSKRISEHMPCYLVSNSIALHKTQKNISALDFSELTRSSLWKFAYGIRNEASYHFEKNGFLAGLLFCLKVITRSFRHVKGWGLRVSVINACWQGYRFKYQQFIELIPSKK